MKTVVSAGLITLGITLYTSSLASTGGVASINRGPVVGPTTKLQPDDAATLITAGNVGLLAFRGAKLVAAEAGNIAPLDAPHDAILYKLQLPDMPEMCCARVVRDGDTQQLAREAAYNAAIRLAGIGQLVGEGITGHEYHYSSYKRRSSIPGRLVYTTRHRCQLVFMFPTWVPQNKLHNP